MWANAETRRRIRAVYSLDGPGFLPEALPEEEYAGMAGRIRRIVPASSLVGMLLHNFGTYETVRSRAPGVMQHDGFSWEIEKARFVLTKDVEEKQKRRNEVINRWIFALSKEERKLFVNALFGIVQKTGATTLTGFAENWKRNLRICLREIRRLDRETGKRMPPNLKGTDGNLQKRGGTGRAGKEGGAELRWERSFFILMSTALF